MQLPRASAVYSALVYYGVYLSRRLQAAKLLDLCAEVKQVNDGVKAAGRARDDANEPIQDAMASRDALDAALDVTTANARAALSGRSAKAMKEAPYTEIFPDGVDFYTAAPLAEQVRRYNLLVERAQAFLPDSDPVRVTLSEQIPALLSDYSAAVDTLDAARSQKSILDSRLDEAEDTWRRTVERTYGALLSRFGKGNYLEGFFPKP
jgi:hypothetical protein